MSHKLSVDFDGSISLPTAIPRAFICLSLTTVCLTDRLTAHSHAEAFAQPCSSRTEQPSAHTRPSDHISGGGFSRKNSLPQSVFTLFFNVSYLCRKKIYTVLCKHYPAIAHCCCWASLKPIHVLN